jgi:hypothetical protein
MGASRPLCASPKIQKSKRDSEVTSRVRVSHGGDDREVWTREFSKEDGHFETRMINRLVEHPHRASVSATSSRPRR